MQVETFIKLTYKIALDKSRYFPVSEGETNNMSTLNNISNTHFQLIITSL